MPSRLNVASILFRSLVLMMGLFHHSASAWTTTHITLNRLDMHSRTSQHLSESSSSIDLSGLRFREVKEEDIPKCFAIESASYPADEAASLEGLQYRQQHASPYFRCAVMDDEVIGFVCATRCQHFEEESMSVHDPNGILLAIHSVVVQSDFRRQGVATAMLQDYCQAICDDEKSIDQKNQKGGKSISKIVLLAKSHLLGFYVKNGFIVLRPSPIVHGQELWYDLERTLLPPKKQQQQQTIRSDSSSSSWFVTTVHWKEPFFEKLVPSSSHWEAHQDWIQDLRQNQGYSIVTGNRVDMDGETLEGSMSSMMFFVANSYEDARAFVLQDPLIANDCVDWKLHAWIPEMEPTP